MTHIPVVKPTRAEIDARTVRFSDLQPVSGGTLDAEYPGCQRRFFNAIGFSQPEGDMLNPVGIAKPAINLAEGYGFAFAGMKPGNGPMMHTHDTVETFIIFEGTWRVEWEGIEGVEGVELGPRDVITFPPGVHRRFECVAVPAGVEEGLISTVIMGNSPGVVMSPSALAKLRAAGLLPAEPEIADQAS